LNVLETLGYGNACRLVTIYTPDCGALG
jgi:hypothetical protein